jgi:hypothetical protein
MAARREGYLEQLEVFEELGRTYTQATGMPSMTKRRRSKVRRVCDPEFVALEMIMDEVEAEFDAGQLDDDLSD